MTQWIRLHLGDVCTKIGSGATPRGGSKVYLDEGEVTLIRSQNVYNEGFRREGLVFISQEHAEELRNVEVWPNDVLLNITGDSVARCCQVPADVLPARVNQHVAIIRPDPTKLDPRFLRYVLIAPQMQAQLLSWARSGGTRNALTKGMIEALEIDAPADIGEQRAIAHILGTLDDKIELLRRMSETLEATARALFKAWFVDFVPVRAKMEGRWKRGQSRPGLPAHLYDLFPDRLVPSELGEIPEGWRVRTLGASANVTSGRRPNKAFTTPKPETSVPVWGGNGPMAYVSQPLFTQPILLTGRVGTLGSVFRISSPSWPSDNTLVVLPHKRTYFEYLYFAMKRIDFAALNRGSTQPLLTQTDLKTHPIIIPSENILYQFHQIISTLFAKVDLIQDETRTLAALRDALLPKLVRGEIRVRDAEKFLERVQA